MGDDTQKVLSQAERIAQARAMLRLRLKQLRDRAGLTNEALARKSGLGERTVQAATNLRGDAFPSRPTFDAIVKACRDSRADPPISEQEARALGTLYEAVERCGTPGTPMYGQPLPSPWSPAVNPADASERTLSESASAVHSNSLNIWYLLAGAGRQRLRRCGAVIAVVALVATGLSLFWPRGRAAVPAVDLSQLNRSLTPVSMPDPGIVSDMLGYGDADGGRKVIPYLGTEMVPTAPTIDSLADTPSIGDEREYTRVAVLLPADGDRYEPIPSDRTVTGAKPGAHVGLWMVIDNNAAEQSDCSDLTGPTVARNVHVRLAVWDSTDGKEHVLRTWISTDNASPRWITDAVYVDTAAKSTLTLRKGYVYRKTPTISVGTALGNFPAVLKPGGVQVADGLLGSCWDNRMVVMLDFTLAKD